MKKEPLLFSNNHIWIYMKDDTTALMGLSDYAKEKLGVIAFVNLPDCGDLISIGTEFGDLESIKTVSDLISPLDGRVVGFNEKLSDNPEMITTKLEDDWLIEVTVEKLEDNLMDVNAYTEYVESL